MLNILHRCIWKSAAEEDGGIITDIFLNLNGRICAEGLLVFGLGGVAIVYIIAPLLDNFFRKIKLRVVGAVCAALIVAFIVDMVYSKKNPNTGKGISTFNDNTPEYMLAEMYQGAEDRYEDRISLIRNLNQSENLRLMILKMY